MFRFYFIVFSSPFFVLWTLGTFKKYMKNPKRFNELACYRLAQKIMDHMRRRGRADTDVYGMENLPKEGGYILYSNHQGKYDALGILIYHEKPCRVLMEKKQSEKIMAKQVIDLVKGKRLDFEDPRQQLRCLKEISEEVKEGARYLIFPEGGYTDNKNTLQKFNAGCFRCALDAKCPIIPVVLIDSYKAMNGNSLKRCRTQVHYLPPISYEEYGTMKKTEVSDLVKGLIQEKLDLELGVQ